MSFLIKMCSDYWGMLGIVVTATSGVFVVVCRGSEWLVAIAMLAVGLALLWVHCVRVKRAKKIVDKGDYVYGTVTSARVYWFTNINTSTSHFGPDDPSVIHPTVLRFAYTYNRQYYEGQSDLLWQAPHYGVGQEIKIYIDAEKPEQYAL